MKFAKTKIQLFGASNHKKLILQLHTRIINIKGAQLHSNEYYPGKENI